MSSRAAARWGKSERRDLGQLRARICLDERVVGPQRCLAPKATVKNGQSARSLSRPALGGIRVVNGNGMWEDTSIITDHDSSVSKAALSGVQCEAEIHGVAGHGILDNR